MSDHLVIQIFAGLMALSLIVYTILDGYDLGVGILIPTNNKSHADKMIASIGPFWDANETWLVLAIGLLLIAFPKAHGIILGQLYLPVFFMILGLILRGVAFDFRKKAAVSMQRLWDRLFKVGSFLAASTQGYMLGMYVMGFESSVTAYVFALVSALCVAAAYVFIGGAWLLMKTEGEIQTRMIRITRLSAWFCAAGIVLVSLLNASFNEVISRRWFGSNYSVFYLTVPLVCFIAFLICLRYLKIAPADDDKSCWVPFVCAVVIFISAFLGLALSYYPFIIPSQLTLWQSASDAASLKFLLAGALIVIPAIIGYTIMSYRVFWGKVDELNYY